MKTCVFAGTFDPVTKGHINIIEKAKSVYDKVFVVVAVNAAKTPLFPLSLRLEVLNDIFANDKKVSVCFWDGYIVDFMKENGITDYVRGVRNEKDNEYEHLAEAFNKNRYPALNTIYLAPDSEFIEVSSTAVREKLLNGEDLSAVIDERIENKLKNFIKTQEIR